MEDTLKIQEFLEYQEQARVERKNTLIVIVGMAFLYWHYISSNDCMHYFFNATFMLSSKMAQAFFLGVVYVGVETHFTYNQKIFDTLFWVGIGFVFLSFFSILQSWFGMY